LRIDFINQKETKSRKDDQSVTIACVILCVCMCVCKLSDGYSNYI